jgi:crossover junction endodeoxyribonuclease RuvC
MRILGIDPGLQTTGFGVVDVDGHKLSYVASGTIRTTTLALGDLPGRLKILFDGITEVAARYEPDVASVEIVFVNVNPQSTLLLGQARGAAITALVASNLPVADAAAARAAGHRCSRRPGHGHHACACRRGDGTAGRGGHAEPAAACDVQGWAELLTARGFSRPTTKISAPTRA